MGLPESIDKVLVAAQKLKSSGAGNEANTKALVIEPVLAALGWNLGDIDAVEREVKVFEGTFLDYALKLAAVPRLYVEAKGISGNLDDKKFMAQTINYANNDGVVWCILTNGLRYRVYKTNEPVAMDKKLLFEVDLTDASQPSDEKAKLLRLLSLDSLESGNLDAFGDRVFTDTRVRQALALLAKEANRSFIAAIREMVGHPRVSDTALQKSVARVLDVPSPISNEKLAHTSRSDYVKASGPPQPPKGQQYSLEHHLSGKSTLVRDLWEAIDNFALSLGPDVTRRVRKQYIGYFRGKRSFLTMEIQKGRVLAYLALTVEAATPWDAQAMRDASKIGHFGMGDIEFSLASDDRVDQLRKLVSISYDRKS